MRPKNRNRLFRVFLRWGSVSTFRVFAHCRAYQPSAALHQRVYSLRIRGASLTVGAQWGRWARALPVALFVCSTPFLILRWGVGFIPALGVGFDSF